MSLTDIDSLCHKVRDSDSRKLIEEAVASFRCGAFRSAIITTWVAICYDILSKARKLTRQDEIKPEFMAQHDKACKENNIDTLLDIEKTLLNTSKEWGWFSGHELALLQRLQNDRHMCAHPSFESDGTWYEPSPEQARAHISHALTILLVQPPLIGKKVIENFQRDLLSNSFPKTTERIHRYMKEYLEQLTNKAVKTLIRFLLTTLFTEEANTTYKGKQYLIPMVLREMVNYKRALYEKVGPACIKGQLLSVKNEVIVLRLFTFLHVLPDLWTDLGDMVKTSVKEGLETIDAEALIKYESFKACGIEELKPILTQRLKEIITYYGDSPSWDQGRERGAAIANYAPMFSEEHVTLLLKVVEDNQPGKNQILTIRDVASENLQSVFHRLPEDIRQATHGVWKVFFQKHELKWSP